MAVVNVECGHGPHNGQDGLQGVAVDNDNELQALFKRVTIFVDNSGEETQSMSLHHVHLSMTKSDTVLR